MGSEATTLSQQATPGRDRRLALWSLLFGPAAASDRELGLAEPVEDGVKLADWQQVPDLVRERYKEAADVKKVVSRLLKHLPKEMPDYGHVFWNPKTKELWAVLSDSEPQSTHQRWHNALKAVNGVSAVRTEAEYGPHRDPDWIRVKKAAALEYLNKPFQMAGALTGGPSPMTNAIVGGLLAGGAGYAGGAIAEQLLPRRYVERGRLRKVLGLLGLGLGTLPGLWEGSVNSLNSNQAGKPLGWRTAITPTNNVPLNPHTQFQSNLLRGGHYKGGEAIDWDTLDAELEGCPLAPEFFLKAAAGFAASLGPADYNLRSVPMDAFNQAIWNDVSKGISARNNPYGTKDPWGDNSQSLHTPPPLGAATAGLVAGIGAQYGNPSLLSPQHFISGLAAAGVDLVTARLAGGVLGVLGGLTPAAQEQLQNAGLWSGLIRGVASSVLGV
jgi:hypothetical protein